MTDDGGIPTNAAQNWDTYNNFRSGDLSPNDGQAAPDLVLEASVCEAECFTQGLVLDFQLGNIGASVLSAGATIEVLATHAGMEAVVDTIDWTEPLPAGTFAAGLQTVIPAADLESVRVRVAAKEQECNTSNNEVVIAGPVCQVPM